MSQPIWNRLSSPSLRNSSNNINSKNKHNSKNSNNNNNHYDNTTNNNSTSTSLRNSYVRMESGAESGHDNEKAKDGGIVHDTPAVRHSLGASIGRSTDGTVDSGTIIANSPNNLKSFATTRTAEILNSLNNLGDDGLFVQAVSRSFSSDDNILPTTSGALGNDRDDLEKTWKTHNFQGKQTLTIPGIGNNGIRNTSSPYQQHQQRVVLVDMNAMPVFTGLSSLSQDHQRQMSGGDVQSLLSGSLYTDGGGSTSFTDDESNSNFNTTATIKSDNSNNGTTNQQLSNPLKDSTRSSSQWLKAKSNSFSGDENELEDELLVLEREIIAQMATTSNIGHHNVESDDVHSLQSTEYNPTRKGDDEYFELSETGDEEEDTSDNAEHSDNLPQQQQHKSDIGYDYHANEHRSIYGDTRYSSKKNGANGGIFSVTTPGNTAGRKQDNNSSKKEKHSMERSTSFERKLNPHDYDNDKDDNDALKTLRKTKKKLLDATTPKINNGNSNNDNENTTTINNNNDNITSHSNAAILRYLEEGVEEDQFLQVDVASTLKSITMSDTDEEAAASIVTGDPYCGSESSSFSGNIPNNEHNTNAEKIDTTKFLEGVELTLHQPGSSFRAIFHRPSNNSSRKASFAKIHSTTGGMSQPYVVSSSSDDEDGNEGNHGNVASGRQHRDPDVQALQSRFDSIAAKAASQSSKAAAVLASSKLGILTSSKSPSSPLVNNERTNDYLRVTQNNTIENNMTNSNDTSVPGSTSPKAHPNNFSSFVRSLRANIVLVVVLLAILLAGVVVLILMLSLVSLSGIAVNNNINYSNRDNLWENGPLFGQKNSNTHKIILLSDTLHLNRSSPTSKFNNIGSSRKKHSNLRATTTSREYVA